MLGLRRPTDPYPTIYPAQNRRPVQRSAKQTRGSGRGRKIGSAIQIAPLHHEAAILHGPHFHGLASHFTCLHLFYRTGRASTGCQYGLWEAPRGFQTLLYLPRLLLLLLLLLLPLRELCNTRHSFTRWTIWVPAYMCLTMGAPSARSISIFGAHR